MAFLTGIGYKRGSYLASMNDKSKSKQIKIVLIYLLLIIFNYILYDVSRISDMKSSKQSQGDFIIYYIFNCEFLFLFIKIVSKLYKLAIDLTSMNMDKIWEYRNITFNIISTIKFSIQIVCEFRFCYVLIKMRIFPIYFFIDVLKSAYRLLKLVMKIYDSYNNSKYIQSLIDYNRDEELKNLGLINDSMTEEEKDKVRKENGSECNICLNEIEKGKYLNCGHVFHLKCIKDWGSLNTNCPICKAPIVSERGVKSKFFNERLGITNVNNNNETNRNRPMTNEELLEHLDLSQVNNMKSSNSNNEPLADGENDYNYKPSFNTNTNPLLEKYLYYQKFSETLKILKESSPKKDNNLETGSVCYGVPTEAVYNRTIENEIKRLEVELINQKLLKIYVDPKTALTNYQEQKI